MRKIISWILAVVLLLSMCACGDQSAQTGETENQTNTQPVQFGSEQNDSDQNKNDDVPQSLTVETVLNTPETNVDEFDYNVTDDGVEITRYNGDGGIVVIPEKIEEIDVILIGENAFVNIDSVTAVKLPDTVKAVCEEAFVNCVALEIFISGAGVRTLGDYAFNGCSSLKKVILNDGLEEIGSICFAGLFNTEVEVPASVTQMKSAFLGASAESPIIIIGESGGYAEQFVQEYGEEYYLVFREK